MFALDTPAAPKPAASQPQDTEQPTDADGYLRRGAASAARQDNDRALADLDRACSMAPQMADCFTRRGEVHGALKQWSLARTDFDTALRLDPGQNEARLQRAWMRANSQDREGALNDLQALDKSLPPQAAMRRDMAMLYTALDLADRALSQWNLWIAAHPKEVDLDQVLNSRCWLRAMLDVDLDQALTDRDQALERQPKNASFLDSRAWVRLRLGELPKAVSDYDRALRIKPDVAWSLYGRGIARTRLGDAEHGQADIAAARRLFPAIDMQAARYGIVAGPPPAAAVP